MMKKIILSFSAFILFLGVNAQMYPRTVLLEHFTQASCGPCATYNPAIEVILNDPQNIGKIVAVKYQTSWPGVDPMNAHNPTDVADRRSVYGVSGVPNSVLDGNYYNGHPNGWNQSSLDSRAGILSKFKIDVKAIYSPDSSFIDIEAKIKSGVAVSGNFVAHIAVVEEHIHFSSPPGSNGETDFYDVMKKLLPNSNGTALSSSWAAGDSVILNESWTHTNVYDQSTLAVVVWIQKTNNDEVMQAGKAQATANVAPSVNFEADNYYVSPGSTVNFTDETGYYPTSWNWNFDVGNAGGVSPTTSTSQNPSATYSNLGDYTVSLSTTNAYGSDSDTKNAFIHVIDCQDISFDIQMDDYAGTVSWIVTNDTSGEVLREGFGYPNVSGGQLISESLCLGNGCYTFKINDVGGNGICCVSGNGSYTVTNNSTSSVLGTGGQFTFSDSLQFCVSNATSAPVASFNASSTTICEHNIINYTDLSTNTATAWDWSFPGGTPSSSTLKNPIIDYQTAGTYPVTLRAFNNIGGDTVTIGSYITVNAGPTINAGSDADVCDDIISTGGVISLSGNMTMATASLWSTTTFGTFNNPNSLNTNYTPSALDLTKGFVVLTLTTTAGNGSCLAAVDKVRFTFTPAPQVDAGADYQICATDSIILLTGLVLGSTGGVWTTGGSGTFANDSALSTSYIITPLDVSGGNITLTLTSTGNGVCNAASDDVIFSVKATPNAVAGDDQTICGGSNIILNGLFSGSNGVRWLTSGSGSFTPAAALTDPIYVPSAADLDSGVVILTLSTTGNGVCSPTLDTLLVTINDCTGFEEKLNSKINVYPNPSKNTIYVDSKELNILSINLVNTLGEVVKSFELNNKKLVSLPISDLSQGTYILNVITQEGTAHKSINIQK